MANLIGWLFSLLLLGILSYGFFSAMMRLIRHRILMYTTGPDALRKISPIDLEHLTAAVYEAQGCKIKKRGVPGQPDVGVDLEILRDGKRGIIQCKRWTHENISIDNPAALWRPGR